MIELRGLAFQIACALRAEGPEPLRLELWHQSPDSAAHLIRAVIDECRDAGIRLARVSVDRYVAVALYRPPGHRGCTLDGVRVETDDTLFQFVEFRRSG